VTVPTQSFGQTIISYALEGPFARAHPEWGRLLYEPDWARQRRFRERGMIVVFLLMVVAGMAMVLMGAWMLTDTSLLSSAPVVGVILLILGTGIGTVIGGYRLSSNDVREMPFRVYEAGVTRTRVGWWDGVRRRQALIPLDRMLGVEYVEGQGRPMEERGLFIRLRDGDVETREELQPWQVEDALEVLIALRSVIPQGFDEGAAALIGEGAAEALFKREGGGEPSTPTVWSSWLIILGIFIFPLPSGITNPFVRGYIIDPTSVMTAIMGTGIWTVPMMVLIWVFTKIDFDSVVENAVLVGDELGFTTFKVFGLMGSYRSSLPVREVAEVRATLRPGYTWAGAALMTVGGERYELPLRLLAAFRARRDFVDAGLVLRNAELAKSSGGPLLGLSVPKCIAIIIGGFWFYLLGGLLAAAI
jgi:hypothetical protein